MDVKVTAEQVCGQVEWTINGKKPKKSVIELPKGSGRHTLDFHLVDRTDLGLRFAEDAIWVHENAQGECPGAGINSCQIQVASLKPRKLSIWNENSGAPCSLQYQLNFVSECGDRFDLDPTIRNGGGGAA